MNIKIEKITPATAQRWLSESNTGNRNIRQSHVNYLANEMLAGRWKETSQGIAFFSDGTLADGQHRLAAVVDSGVTICLPVARDLERDVMPVIDRGATRSLADYMHLQHGVKDANLCCAAARGIVSFCLSHQNYVIPPAVAIETIRRYGSDINAAIAAVRETRPLRKGWLVGVLAFARRRHRAEIDAFLDGFGSGEGIVQGMPEFALRKWFISQSPRALQAANAYRRAAVESVFNVLLNKVQGRQITHIKSGPTGLQHFLEGERAYVSKLQESMAHLICSR